MAKTTPSLADPKDTHCSACQVVIAKNVDTSESDSAKIRKIIELVESIEQRSNKTEKIIIFSQFTMMLRLIQEVLNERGLKFVQCKRSNPVVRASVERIDVDDGSMSQKDRQKVVDRIKSEKDTRIILMSFKAGGVGKSLSSGSSLHRSNWATGLNLTACNNVILVDLWWNPALEVRYIVSTFPPRLRFGSTTSLGPSVWTGASHWPEEAGEHMEVDDRRHSGGADPGRTYFMNSPGAH